MKLSGGAAQTFLDRPPPETWCALIHCADEGVAADAAAALAGAWAKASDAGGGATERLVLTEEEIAKSPAIVLDTLEARSLLGDRRILTVRLSNERISKHLVAAIEAGDGAGGGFETRCVLVAGSLKKSSKLRKTAEAARTTAALQLFEDTDQDVAARLDATLSAQGVALEDAAKARFLAGLPNDRRLVRAEMEKLCVFGHGLGRALTPQDVEEIAASGIDAAQGRLVTYTLTGQASAALGELDRLEAAKTSPITLLRAFQREVDRLLAAHSEGVSSPAAAQRLRPPVWRDQWPAFRDCLRLWPPASLVRALARIRDTEADAKLAAAMSAPSLRRLVASLSQHAAARRAATGGAPN
ncbi:MAG: DNA polymerase III subunit delta [Pseudomonadota bacterium]